jgi:dihydrofolate reductase
MGKIALSQNTSLDGVMQSPGPTDVPFKYRGWAVDFDGSREGARFNYEEEVGLEEAQNSEAHLLGRVTYEAMQAFWPTAEGELADRLNELPKYVVSSTLTDPPWNATVLGQDWPEEVARLHDPPHVAEPVPSQPGTRASATPAGSTSSAPPPRSAPRATPTTTRWPKPGSRPSRASSSTGVASPASSTPSTRSCT